ncbi:relaxase/mobilization nuclease domain-containing protein [Devosia honganensis]|uniref:Relaxase/mobilization nuclease domain-containing protein n=1 Tax=Devosia honganensis TaxID=1610527 RepID=A0ABV7X3W9_9HYPH
MILVGSQRGGAGNLARHLLNEKDNDHVTVHELRGFTARDLHGAFEEAHAISLGTNCKQFLFSLSFNPPKDVAVDVTALLAAAERAEEKLGLSGQPRAVVIHEKNGRRHAHVVWSRIDAQEMKAVNLPHFKNRLNSLSKDLFLEHGWQLPDGYKENGWKNPLNFTLAEWQQAKRLDLDPREIKQVFREAWAHSDGQQSFKAALEESGFFLARGDRRGFVALDIHGEVYSVARMAGIKTKDLNARLGSPDALPSVNEVKADTHRRMSSRLREHLKTIRAEQQQALTPLVEQRQKLVAQHRAERTTLEQGQERRWKAEAQERQQRLRTGLMGVVDFFTGRAAAMRRQNEREAFQCFARDRAQKEALYKFQSGETAALHKQVATLKARQRQERMQLAARIGQMLRISRESDRKRERQPDHTPQRGIDFSL